MNRIDWVVGWKGKRSTKRVLAALLPLLLLCGLMSSGARLARAQQDGGGRQRLILRDGSYQVVLRYEVKDGRVRFRSTERDDSGSGGWEELPENLVDWPAPEKWNYAHAPDAKPDAGSPAAQEAAELDREAAAGRAAEAARQPEVAPGLRLPDESGVWGLDMWQGTPELIRIRQSDGDLNLDMGHSVKGIAIPQGGARDVIRLAGYKALVSFHVPRPVLYVALDVKNEPAREDAMVVDTHGSDGVDARAAATAGSKKDQTQQASPNSTYALVRLRVFKGERTASGAELRGLSTGGDADGSAEIVALQREMLPGGRWMRLTPKGDLNLGQYTLVELLGGGGFNVDGWDFGVNPMAAENKGVFLPVEGR
jgi:hypothetical protein